MIYLIKTEIGGKKEEQREYSKMNAAQYYRIKVRELVFPDNITVEILNDGEDNG